jgi:hypothetical protein
VTTRLKIKTVAAVAALTAAATLATAAPASAAPSGSTTQASPGCDGTSPPPNGVDIYSGTYDGFWLFGWDACEECDANAKLLASMQLLTYCWETAPPAQLAELWYGTSVGPTGTVEKPKKITSREQLHQVLQEAERRQ